MSASSTKLRVRRSGVLEPGASVSRRFRIEEPLDAGRLAEVYRAHDGHTGRTVALKVLTDPVSRRDVPGRRARRDLKALQRLTHRNVVQLFDTGISEDGRPWLAMEYVEGDTLRRYLRRHRILSVQDMLPLALQMAEGLSAAHAIDVLHRDLKPENVFVLRSGLVKISDFGTARLLSDVLGERGVGLGTPAYMAPERLIEDASTLSEDPRSDIYSLGIIEYEMLAGYNPVLGDQRDLSRTEVSWRQAAVPPRVPVGVPLEVWSVLEPTLRKEPDRRPASAQEHALALERLIQRLGAERAAVAGAWALTPARTPADLLLRRALRSVLTGAAIGAVGGALVFLGWWLGTHHARTNPPRDGAPALDPVAPRATPPRPPSPGDRSADHE